jgi:hypothetical protein
MMKSDNSKAFFAALSRLQNDPDFLKFVEYIEIARNIARENLETAHDLHTVGQFQGEARLAATLIDLIDQARKNLAQAETSLARPMSF